MEIIVPKPNMLEDGTVDIWPTLGPQICNFIESRFVYGPGSLKGEPYVVRDDFRYLLYRLYEHYPEGYKETYGTESRDLSGRRRFQKGIISLPKGSAKCLAPDTILYLETGEEVRADEVKPGQSVQSYLDGEVVYRPVAAVEPQSAVENYLVKTTDGREITVSEGHPFLVSGDWKKVENLHAGDPLTSVSEGVVGSDRVLSVDAVGERETIGIEIEDTHVHVTNGLVTHNTELMAIVSLLELHPDAPIRFNGYDPEAEGGLAPGRSVMSPFIPMLAPTLEQLKDLAYGAAMEIVKDIDDSSLFDPNKERIMINGEGESKIIPVAASAGRLDGQKPTFQGIDEPLALDTEVPTTEGFKTIETLQPGDFVFDRNGSPVRVLGKSDVHEGRPCYEVTFRNGEKVVTDENHRWKAVEWSNRPKGEQVVTTKQMKERGLTTGYGLRWRLPRGSGWEAALPSGCPIDPYLLGIWLGDGSSDAGYIHTSETDFEALSAGFNFSESNNPKKPTIRRWLPVGLRTMLRHEKLLSNKHIPDRYLMESREWRLSLLAGLIDSDGYVLNGAVTLVQGKFALADKVRQLAVSLGFKASINSSDDPRSRTGKMWKVQFCPTEAVPTRIPRKEILGRANHLSEWPQIVSIKPVESVPVQCIEVDNDDHLFVFGRSGYLTHNTHRMVEDRHIAAVTTIENNLKKRFADDPWQLSTTTAGDPGEPSMALREFQYGMKIAEGKIKDPTTFFYHRATSDENAKFDTMENRIKALKEASGPEAAKFRDLFSVAKEWDDENADHSYLERVWCNRWVQSSTSAFDAKKFRELGDESLKIAPGSTIVLGFDGAISDDSTALVATEIETGIQNLVGIWEKPEGATRWQVPVGEVNAVMEDMFEFYDVLKLYADPPYWQESISKWAGRWEKRVVEWPTRNETHIYYALRAYSEAINMGEVGHDNNQALIDHIAASGKNLLNRYDDEGKQKYRLAKRQRDKKIDAAMAAVLSWQARLDALSEGAQEEEEQYVPRRIR